MFLHVFIRQDFEICLLFCTGVSQGAFLQTDGFLAATDGAWRPDDAERKKMQRDRVRRDGVEGRVLERKWQLCQESAGEF